MSHTITAWRAELGRIVATPAALDALTANDQLSYEFLQRHARGDWGDVDNDDWRANDDAALYGDRLLSAYHLQDGTKIWIITEWDRSVTTILLPDDY